MVKSRFFVVKKTNLAKFISHGKITFCVVKKKTNLAKFISHGKITFLCGEKKQILLNSFLMVKSHFFVVKKQILLNSFLMVKSHSLW